MANNRQQYIFNYARTLAGQLGIRVLDFEAHELNPARIMRAVKDRHWEAIHSRVRAENAETRGSLASAGIGEQGEPGFQMSLVHGDETWLNQGWGGSVLLTQLAATAVVSSIAKNIHTFLVDEAESDEFLWGEYMEQIQADK